MWRSRAAREAHTRTFSRTVQLLARRAPLQDALKIMSFLSFFPFLARGEQVPSVSPCACMYKRVCGGPGAGRAVTREPADESIDRSRWAAFRGTTSSSPACAICVSLSQARLRAHCSYFRGRAASTAACMCVHAASATLCTCGLP